MTPDFRFSKLETSASEILKPFSFVPVATRLCPYPNCIGLPERSFATLWRVADTAAPSRSVTARKDSDHTPHRIPKHISRSETCGTRRSNVGNEMPVTEASFSGNGN